MTPSTRSFAAAYRARTGHYVAHNPASFRVAFPGFSATFRPELYDRTANIFFAVIESREAYERQMWLMQAFRHCFPKIKFQIVNPDGSPFSATASRWPTASYRLYQSQQGAIHAR